MIWVSQKELVIQDFKVLFYKENDLSQFWLCNPCNLVRFTWKHFNILYKKITFSISLHLEKSK